MKTDFVRRVPLFASLSDAEFKSLEYTFVVKRYNKNQVIFQEEETGNYMYIVLSGKIKVTKSDGSGRESLLAIHQPGDYFGEMSLLDGRTSPATVSAMEDCKIVTINRQDFTSYLMTNQKVMHQMIRVLCARLRQAWLQIHGLSHNSAEARIRTEILQLSSRHGLPDAKGVLINLKITHQELAEMAGTSRETVSRTIASLRRKGILKVDQRRLILLDPKGLSSAS